MPGPSNEWIVGRHGSIVAQPQHLPLVMTEILRILHVDDGRSCRHVEHAVAAEGDS